MFCTVDLDLGVHVLTRRRGPFFDFDPPIFSRRELGLNTSSSTQSFPPIRALLLRISCLFSYLVFLFAFHPDTCAKELLPNSTFKNLEIRGLGQENGVHSATSPPQPPRLQICGRRPFPDQHLRPQAILPEMRDWSIPHGHGVSWFLSRSSSASHVLFSFFCFCRAYHD